MRIQSGVKVRSGMIRYNYNRVGAPNARGCNASLLNCGTITFGGRCTLCTSSCIRTIQDSELYLGDDSLICEEVNISCFESVRIGHRSWVAHRSQVLESNNHYMADLTSATIARAHNPIAIGDDCWVCNSSTILGGTTLPNGTLVASNSLVRGDFSDTPANPMIAGIPAKVIGSGKRRVDNADLMIRARDYIRQHPGEVYTMTPDDIRLFT
jgi:acetyltransferase-like isoleucine patch superfamily enzyme